MGGGDKGRLTVGQRPMIQHVIDRAATQVNELVLNVNGDVDRFDDLGLRCVTDSVDGFAGPLAGILAGLDAARELGHPWIVTFPTDTPFLPSDLVHKLSASDSQITLAATTAPDGKWLAQPACGRFNAELADDLRAALRSGVRKIRQWTQTLDESLVTFDRDAFFNVNTPAELAQAQRLMGGDSL